MPSLVTSTSAQEFVPRNRLRKSIVFQNEDTTDAIFVRKERTATPSVSTTIHDHRIGPGGSLSLNSLMDGKEDIQDRWTVIAAANTPRVSYFETEDVER